MSFGYAHEKLWQAVVVLLRAGSIQNRLANAAGFLLRVKTDEIPEPHRHDFETVLHTLTKYRAEREGEGSIHASVRKLTDEEASALGQKILSIYLDLRNGI